MARRYCVRPSSLLEGLTPVQAFTIDFHAARVGSREDKRRSDEMARRNRG